MVSRADCGDDDQGYAGLPEHEQLPAQRCRHVQVHLCINICFDFL